MKRAEKAIKLGNGLPSLAMGVSGYQFDFPAYEGWDSEWLILWGRVRSADGCWAFESPCMTVSELGALAAWFSGLASGLAPRRLDFMEPTVGFEGRISQGGVLLTVNFSQEASPPWVSVEERLGPAYSLSVKTDRETLSRAFRAASRLLEKYPSRLASASVIF